MQLLHTTPQGGEIALFICGTGIILLFAVSITGTILRTGKGKS